MTATKDWNVTSLKTRRNPKPVGFQPEVMRSNQEVNHATLTARPRQDMRPADRLQANGRARALEEHQVAPHAHVLGHDHRGSLRIGEMFDKISGKTVQLSIGGDRQPPLDRRRSADQA